jgi:hypothetical protein
MSIGPAYSVNGTASEVSQNAKIGLLDYNDNVTATTPIAVAADTSTVLTNDAAGAFTNKNFLPPGVTEVWDEVGNVFDWDELKLGDMIDIRIDIDVTTLTTNTDVSIALHLGTGGNSYSIPWVQEMAFKTTGLHKINVYNGIYLGDLNTLNNGGQFKILCDKAVDVRVLGWYVKVLVRDNTGD